MANAIASSRRAARIQGYIVFYVEEDHVLLGSVAVFPTAAGKGVGRALINYCEASARASGRDIVRLYTNVKMTANLSIYPKLGYAEVGRCIEAGFARVYFEKKVS